MLSKALLTWASDQELTLNFQNISKTINHDCIKLKFAEFQAFESV